jgi:ATP-dependent Clp protease adaptor protein ClpS
MHKKNYIQFDSESDSGFSAQINTILDLDKITKKEPKYNVVLIDDDDHTYDYVIEMLMKIFGHSREDAYVMACEVDFKGKVIVYTTSKTEAERKRDEILNYGVDYRLSRSKGSMNALIEPVEEC